MQKVWIDIEFWIEVNAPHLLNYLAPPATIQEIEHAESRLNITFSEAFKDFYTIHNGQIDESESLICGQAILSLERIVDEWQKWTELLTQGEFNEDGEISVSDPDPGVKNDWWNIKWIPVTSNGCGDNFCIDMDPAQGGNVGQIISMWHDAGWRELKGNSFEEWIIQYANDLTKGKYVYEDRLGIWKK